VPYFETNLDFVPKPIDIPVQVNSTKGAPWNKVEDFAHGFGAELLQTALSPITLAGEVFFPGAYSKYLGENPDVRAILSQPDTAAGNWGSGAARIAQMLLPAVLSRRLRARGGKPVKDSEVLHDVAGPAALQAAAGNVVGALGTLGAGWFSNPANRPKLAPIPIPAYQRWKANQILERKKFRDARNKGIAELEVWKQTKPGTTARDSAAVFETGPTSVEQMFQRRDKLVKEYGSKDGLNFFINKKMRDKYGKDLPDSMLLPEMQNAPTVAQKREAQRAGKRTEVPDVLKEVLTGKPVAKSEPRRRKKPVQTEESKKFLEQGVAALKDLKARRDKLVYSDQHLKDMQTPLKGKKKLYTIEDMAEAMERIVKRRASK
jgi:hypothetical protein